MSERVRNLWPDIDVDVLLPVTILRAQATYLQRFTKGVLRADVVTSESETEVEHKLDIVAPVLSYRQTLLSASHKKVQPYPVTVRIPNRSLPEQLYTEESFTSAVSGALNKNGVVAIIQSLLARSREATAQETECFIEIGSQRYGPAPCDVQGSLASGSFTAVIELSADSMPATSSGAAVISIHDIDYDVVITKIETTRGEVHVRTIT